MSWWFIEGPAARGEFGSLLDVLKAELPEGLLRRYAVGTGIARAPWSSG